MIGADLLGSALLGGQPEVAAPGGGGGAAQALAGSVTTSTSVVGTIAIEVAGGGISLGALSAGKAVAAGVVSRSLALTGTSVGVSTARARAAVSLAGSATGHAVVTGNASRVKFLEATVIAGVAAVRGRLSVTQATRVQTVTPPVRRVRARFTSYRI